MIALDYRVGDQITTRRMRVLIEVRTAIACDSCLVAADANQFETALLNMAVNARDAMNGEGTLTNAVTDGLVVQAGALRTRRPDQPVVLTTGYIEALADDGLDGVQLLRKPCSVEALCRLLCQVCGLKRAKAITRRSVRTDHPICSTIGTERTWCPALSPSRRGIAPGNIGRQTGVTT